MTEVAFHFNVPDKLPYACRLLRKAAASGARVIVTAEPADLQRLDVLLWTFAPLEFIPHCDANSEPRMLQASPVVLTSTPASAPHHGVLLNLGGSVPEGFERFERLIELVTSQEQDRLNARQRWKYYTERGYQLTRHDVAQSIPIEGAQIRG